MAALPPTTCCSRFRQMYLAGTSSALLSWRPRLSAQPISLVSPRVSGREQTTYRGTGTRTSALARRCQPTGAMSHTPAGNVPWSGGRAGRPASQQPVIDLIDRDLVGRDSLDLRYLTVAHVVNGRSIPVERPPLASGRQSDKRHDVLVSRHHFVRLEAQCATGHLGQRLHIGKETPDARPLTRQRVRSAYAADNVLREMGPERLQITARKRLVDVAPQNNVRVFQHAEPLP